MKFSLLVPSYNRPEFIRETILSLLGNSAPDVEIIVSDDASPKRVEIRCLLADLVEADKIKYLQQESNLGWSNNRNALVRAAQGEYIILLGDDDRLKCGALSRLRHWMERRPGADFYAFGYDVIDANGAYHYNRRSPREMLYQVPFTNGWQEIFYWNALLMWSHHPFTMCFRRQLGLQIPYQSNAGTSDDALLVFDALQQGRKLFVIPESLFEWRRVLDLTNGYINLSSEGNRSLIGNRALWCQLLRRTDIRDDVRAVLISRAFIRRFLLMSRFDSWRLAKMAGKWNASEFRVDHPLLDPVLCRPETSIDRAMKLYRVTRILGWPHLAVVIKYYIDRWLYRLSFAKPM